MRVEYFRHNIEENDIERVNEALRSPFLTTGKYVKEFEERFSSFINAKHTLGLNSCTAALHLGLLVCGISEGDVVITTPYTFVSTANSVLHTGAEIRFVDIEYDTGCINPVEIEKSIGPNTKAILPVHLYGQMCDMIRIREIADNHNLCIIEDCAHSIEATRDNIKPCQLADAGAFSFYANKNITSGEGGAFVTNSQTIYEKAKLLSLHGMSKNAEERYHKAFEQYDVVEDGWKYNMSNVQAAMLIGQLDRIMDYHRRRIAICERYEQAFSKIDEIDFMKVKENSTSARHLFTILVDENRRDVIIKRLQTAGIGISVHFKPVHLMKFYRDKYGFTEGDFPVAEKIYRKTITLPLYPKLTDSEVKYIIDTVISSVKPF